MKNSRNNMYDIIVPCNDEFCVWERRRWKVVVTCVVVASRR